MSLITINIALTEEHKQKAIEIINDTIDKTSEKINIELTYQEKRRIKNLSLDQVNVNVTQKNKLKTMWIFDIEDKYPVLLDIKNNLSFEEIKNDFVYKVKNNGEWEITDNHEDNFDKETFEKVAIDNLMQDFETAAFYGTLSYEVDVYE